MDTSLPDSWRNVPTLHGEYVRLEPLRTAHAEALRDAAADGRLWELRYTNVPTPEGMPAYVLATLELQAAGGCLPFVVRDASGDIVGTTRFYDLAPAVPRLQIGY